MKIRGILFDKDGTLIDFYEVWGKAYGPAISHIFRMYGLNTDFKEKVFQALCGTNGRIAPESPLACMPYPIIAKHFYDSIPESDKSLLPDMHQLANDLENAFYKEVVTKRTSYPVFTDMVKLAHDLQERNIRIGVATTDEENSTLYCLETLGISDAVSFCATAGSPLPSKPDGRLIRAAADFWNIHPQEIAVVGDTPSDIHFAHGGSAIAIGVLSGTGKKDDLQKEADFIIPSIADLVSLLDSQMVSIP